MSEFDTRKGDDAEETSNKSVNQNIEMDIKIIDFLLGNLASLTSVTLAAGWRLKTDEAEMNQRNL